MRNLIVIMFLLAACLPDYARQLSPQEALTRVSASSVKKAKRIKSSELQLIKTVNSSKGMPGVYLFTSESGSLAVSGSDKVAPVLGYLDGKVSEGDMPDGMDYWLRYMADEVAYGEESDAVASSIPVVGTAISPLLTTAWGQTGAYNKYTPVIGGEQSPSGCVATALSQIMYYYKWPINPVGSSFYYDSNGLPRSMDFDGMTFEWDKMTDSYDSESSDEAVDAVATLMKAVGYGVRMNYGKYSSGAVSTDAPIPLRNNFGYSSNLDCVRREAYTRQEWDEMLYGMLANGQPIYHTGRDGVWSNSGGHAFVCDGYDGDGYFHFNWGWDGIYNGYFLTSCLVPDGAGTGGYINGYNYSQVVFVNFYPDNGKKYADIEYVKGSNFKYDESSKTISASFTRYPNASKDTPYDLALSITPKDEGLTNIKGITRMSGSNSSSWQINDEMTAGLDKSTEYIVRIIWRSSQEDSWKRVIPPVEGSLLYYSGVFGGILRYENGEWTFSKAVVDRDKYDITIDDIQFNDNYYLWLNKQNTVSFFVTNHLDDYFFHAIRLYFVNAETGSKPKYINLNLEIDPNETTKIKYTLTALSGIPEGQYYIEVTEANTGELIYTDKSKTYYVIDESSITTIDDGTFVYKIMHQDYAELVSTVSGSPVGGEVFLPAFINYEGTEVPVRQISQSLNTIIDVQSVKSLKIENPITEIPKYALQNCTQLEVLELPESLKSIGNCAFEKCNNLKELVIPDEVESIGNSAFYGCNALETLILSENLKSIGRFAFSSCNNLKELRTPKGLESIDFGVFFNCNALEKLTLSEGLKSIGPNSFNRCENLKNLTIPSGVESIGGGAFNECNALEKLALPEGLKLIEGMAFYNCCKLKELVLPNGLDSIGNCAFSGCRELEKLILPESLRSIDTSVFLSYTNNLQKIIYNFPNVWDYTK